MTKTLYFPTTFQDKQCLELKHFIVVKESNNFYGVHEKGCYDIHKPITSGTSFSNALKKAKLLQTGYNICKEFYM